jgi:hypothetical protein
VKTHALLACIVFLPLLGCVNGFSEFYAPNLAMRGENLPAFSGKTEILLSADVRSDAALLKAKGYSLLGTASFEDSGRSTKGEISEQALKVGADLVVYSKAYDRTESVTSQQARYIPGETATVNTQSSTNLSVNGNAGYLTGNSSTNQTSQIVTSGKVVAETVQRDVERYRWTATFWRNPWPAADLGFGAKPKTKNPK